MSVEISSHLVWQTLIRSHFIKVFPCSLNLALSGRRGLDDYDDGDDVFSFPHSIEDKTLDDERGRGRGERYMGPTTDFKEKESYRPDVKLEYVDDEGRKLNAKEAFR